MPLKLRPSLRVPSCPMVVRSVPNPTAAPIMNSGGHAAGRETVRRGQSVIGGGTELHRPADPGGHRRHPPALRAIACGLRSDRTGGNDSGRTVAAFDQNILWRGLIHG